MKNNEPDNPTPPTPTPTHPLQHVSTLIQERQRRTKRNQSRKPAALRTVTCLIVVFLSLTIVAKVTTEQYLNILWGPSAAPRKPNSEMKTDKQIQFHVAHTEVVVDRTRRCTYVLSLNRLCLCPLLGTPSSTSIATTMSNGDLFPNSIFSPMLPDQPAYLSMRSPREEPSLPCHHIT